MYVSGSTINAGGAGNTIGGGRAIPTLTFTPAIAETGTAIISAKSNVLKSSLFILMPPLHYHLRAKSLLLTLASFLYHCPAKGANRIPGCKSTPLFQIHQRFFQLKKIIANDILIDFRPVTESPRGHIDGCVIGYAVAERSY
jgi:hypothetical protein